MKIIIGADTVPTESNRALFSEGNVRKLLGEELLEIWNSSDVRILNLEVPITDRMDPIKKCGPNLVAPKSTIKGIRALDPTLLTLANNHIMDQGAEGLKDTTDLLKEYGIGYVGAGDNISEACRPYIIGRNGIRVGIYACAEHEFSIAGPETPGANPFDPLDSLDHISALKSRCDYVIVLYHGGKEHYRYPSPYLQKVCRKMAQKGADLVICQHSHCIGCFEVYNGSALIYGQGNFIFDDNGDDKCWQTSLLVRVSIDERPDIDFIPLLKAGNGVRLAAGKDADEILEAFRRRSEVIMEEGFIEQQYAKFAEENHLYYIRELAGFGKWLSRIDRRLLNGRLAKCRYSEKQLLAIQNYIECESHRELLINGLYLRQRQQWK